MKIIIKNILHRLCQLLTLPLVIPCKIEELIYSKHTEVVFQTCTHIVAMLPGLPGVFLRRGFYSLVLDECSPHCYIGFGSIFTHRSTTVGEHVYIGSYAIIGSSALGDRCLIGSRVSILSGKNLHELGEDLMWSPYSADRLIQVKLSENVWVGEGAIVSADIGKGTQVGAGSVVSSNTKSHIIVTGNPARFVKKLDTKE